MIQVQTVDHNIYLILKYKETSSLTHPHLVSKSDQANIKVPKLIHTHGCESSFKSKIQRFVSNQHKEIEKQQQNKDIYECLMEKDTSNRKIGKLFGIQRDLNKINQSIPSIPSNQQSFGYRIDSNTKKLVQNQNPNVLLARKTFANSVEARIFNTTDSYTAPGSYFLNGQVYKKIKGLKWQKDSDVQTIEQKQNDFYKGSQLMSLSNVKQKNKREWLEKGNIITSKQKRFEYQKFNKKQQLIKNALKKKFQPYIANDQEISSLINRNQKYNRHNNSLQKLGIQSNQTQCFLSKERRFFQQQLMHKLQEKNNFRLMNSNLHVSDGANSQKRNINKKSKKQNTENVKSLGFGYRQPRFHQLEQLKNRRVGPGTYNNNCMTQKDKNGIGSLQKQKKKNKRESKCEKVKFHPQEEQQFTAI